jgi:uncharacterized protein YukE
MAGRVAVDPGALHELASEVREVAGGIGDLKGDLSGVAASFDEPPRTAAALDRLVGTWRGAIDSMDDAVDALASGLDAAADAYAAADAPLTGGGRSGR